jgi:hypothetical protein
MWPSSHWDGLTIGMIMRNLGSSLCYIGSMSSLCSKRVVRIFNYFLKFGFRIIVTGLCGFRSTCTLYQYLQLPAVTPNAACTWWHDKGLKEKESEQRLCYLKRLRGFFSGNCLASVQTWWWWWWSVHHHQLWEVEPLHQETMGLVTTVYDCVLVHLYDFILFLDYY